MRKNKTISIVALMMAVLMQFSLLQVFAADVPSAQTAVSGQETIVQSSTSSGGIDVELIGTVNSSVISVIVPTQVKFAVLEDKEGWNKVVSPDFNITNIGTVKVNVSISKSEVATPNVQLTKNQPVLSNGVKQIRIAVAPKANYQYVTNVDKYMLHAGVSDINSILLTENGLDYASGNDIATFNIYGDVSSGWTTGEQFGIRTVFKVAASR